MKKIKLLFRWIYPSRIVGGFQRVSSSIVSQRTLRVQ
jgi:hypothetical protein